MATVITDVTELQAMENDLTADYELFNNIDASATSGWNGGAGFDPIGKVATRFTGSFDGKGYTITDLFINRPTEAAVGLFGITDESGEIKNVGLVTCDITGKGATGALIGQHDVTAGKVSDCYSTGTVEGHGLGVGGLLGTCYGDIEDCYSTCNVTGVGGANDISLIGGFIGSPVQGTLTGCYSTGTVTVTSDNDIESVSGFLGDTTNATLTRCYATGDVSVTAGGRARRIGGFGGRGTTNLANCYTRSDITISVVDTSWGDIGGFIGLYATSEIDDCYSTGSLTITAGVSDIGGFCGDNSGTISDCFWDTETSGEATSDGGTGETTAQMKTQATFTDAGWDFSTIWEMSSVLNDGYPSLIDVSVISTVTTQAVSSIADTTATGNGNITVLGTPNPTAHGVCYNTTGSPTTADDTFDEGAATATGAFTSNMTSLSINTKYYVKAYATNAKGTGYGDEVDFTTLGVPTVITETCESVVGATATGRGEITVIGNPTPTAHGHCWNTTADPTTSPYSVDNGAASVIGTFISSITGLTPGTGYYTRAYATNTQGTVYGANVYFVAPKTGTMGRAGYTWDEDDNLRSFDENALERQYLHYDSLDALDHNVNITAGNSFTCDNVTARILQGITGLTVTDSPTFLALTIGDLSGGYINLYGTADYPIDLYSASINTGGADIRLSNQAKIDNTTHDLLRMSVDVNHYFEVGNTTSTIKGTFIDLNLTQALRFTGTAANIDGEVVFRDKLTVGRPANGVDFILYGVTANYRVMWDANGETNGRWTFGDNDYGVDVAFRGATASAYALWDASADSLVFASSTINMGSNKITSLATPTVSTDAVTKEYVDIAIANLRWDYYFNNTDSEIDSYYEMAQDQTGDDEVILTTPSPLSGSAQDVFQFISDVVVPFNSIQAGVIDVHVHAKRATGNKSIELYAIIYEYEADTDELPIAATEVSSELTDDETSYAMHAVLSTDYEIAATSKLLVKILANLGTGSSTTISIYVEGTHDSRISVPVPTHALDDVYIRQSLFNADTFLYASSDDTPVATSPASVLAALSGHAGAAFSLNSEDLSYIGHIGLGNIAADADIGIKYSETLTAIPTDDGKEGIHIALTGHTTAGIHDGYLIGGIFSPAISASNTQDWTSGEALVGVSSRVSLISGTAATKTIAAATNFYADASFGGAANDMLLVNYHGLLVKARTLVGNDKLTNDYGIKVEDQEGGATLNYAIHTGAGLVHFGDEVDIESKPLLATMPLSQGYQLTGTDLYVDDTAIGLRWVWMPSGYHIEMDDSTGENFYVAN